MTSAKEKVWLEEYLKCWNASEAARRAEYAWPGKMGTRKLAKFGDEIQERIDELVMSADEALVRLSEIARGEWAEYITPDGGVDIAQMVRDSKAHLVTKIRDTQHGKSIEFCDMQSAIEKIGKAHGVFVNKTEISGPDGGPVQTEDVCETRQRLLADLQERVAQEDEGGAGIAAEEVE